MEPGCGHGSGLLSRGARPDRFDHESLGVAKQRGYIVHVLRRTELDDPVTLGVVYIHYHETEALAHFRREDKTGRIHHVRKSKLKREVIGAWVGLVSCEK